MRAGDPDPSTNPWGGVHWRTKAPVGDRLAAVAEALCYGNETVQTRGPMALKAVRVRGGVQVSFDDKSLGEHGLVAKPMTCPFYALKQPQNIARCGWFEAQTRGNWSNTSATISADAKSITISASAEATAVRYLYADWPVAQLFNAEGLPATPFWITL